MSVPFASAFEAFLANGGSSGPAWAPPLRRAAMGRFADLGLPSTRDEDWRFTSLAPIAEGGFALPPAAEVSRAAIEAFLVDAAWPTLVFVNGRYSEALSRPGALPSGVRLQHLSRALHETPDIVRSHLERGATEAAALTALNTAFLSDGLLLTVERGVEMDTPIQVLYLAAGSERIAISPRNLIVLGEGARAAVLECYAALADAPYFTNAVTDVTLGAGARLDHWKVQRESERAYHVGTTDVRQARDSELESFAFSLGGALSRTNTYTLLDGEGAHCTLNGLYVGHGRQHLDHQTRVEHAAPGCTSHEVYKGILDDQAHAVFNGKVYVRPEAQKTDGKQTNKNLLLSDGAKVDTKPQLEIFADDVRCTHGATVGRLDEVALFYLRSRGLPAPRARRILTYAFAADVIEEIRNSAVAVHLERLVNERLPERLEG